MEAYEELVAANILGKKTGAGFYKYNKKERERASTQMQRRISKYVKKGANAPKTRGRCCVLAPGLLWGGFWLG